MTRSSVVLLWSLTSAHAAVASPRPPEAILQDRASTEAEVRDLERRAKALDDQAAERNQRIKKRLRALYKLSSGGYLRLLAGAEDVSTLEAREAAVARVLKRDLDELQAVRDEARAVDEAQAQHSERLARAQALSAEAEAALSEAPTGLQRQMGKLIRPVPGAIVHGFGVTTDADLKTAVSQRGVELDSHRGEAVRAAAAGKVVWIGDVPGHGRGVAVDHGDGYVTLTARLRTLHVAEGDELPAGAVLGLSAGGTIYFELAQGGTPFNPAPWLAH
jgi:septal ring factor EnvC (AmiA/AmiB activator)